MSRILLVEDDRSVAGFVAGGLRGFGHDVVEAFDGRAGLIEATGTEFDLAILDRMMSGLDGLSLLKSLRGAGITTPVLMLTAMSAVEERVRGLRAGADDYLVKPFSFDELSARVEALLRRPPPAETHDGTTLSVGDLVLDLATHKARRGAREIALKPREVQMLAYLMRRAGRVVTRTMLLEGVWEYHFDPQTNVIDVHISRLRRKIDGPGERPLIETVRGAGYRIVAG